ARSRAGRGGRRAGPRGQGLRRRAAAPGARARTSPRRGVSGGGCRGARVGRRVHDRGAHDERRPAADPRGRQRHRRAARAGGKPVSGGSIMGENVTLVRAGTVATVTLNRPDRRNSLSDAMLGELGQAFAELRDDASTRVVIVTGAPPVFSAGADAPHAKAKTDEERRRLFLSRKSQFRRLFERATTLLENLEQATICMINGHAVGGGWGLTLACAFLFAAAEAPFWYPEVDLGVPLGVASTTRFVRLVGPARAKEIIMTGRRYPAAEAQALGLVHGVVAGPGFA